MINLNDIAWAAGFLEGDGHFGWHRDGKFLRKDGTYGKKYGQPVIVADQVNIEPLLKLQTIFGGWIGGPYKTNRQSRYRWEVSSNKAASIMMTLWHFLSTQKRKQVEHALGTWRLTPTRGGFRRKSEKRDD